jgi:hypothetical protein
LMIAWGQSDDEVLGHSDTMKSFFITRARSDEGPANSVPVRNPKVIAPYSRSAAAEDFDPQHLIVMVRPHAK